MNRRRVLVADDNQDAAESMVALLELEGYEVIVATDGNAALREFNEHNPDVVVLDISMPGLDGYQLAGLIRSAGSRALLIAMTGWGDRTHKQQALDAGFDMHFTKPVDFDTLLQAISAPR